MVKSDEWWQQLRARMAAHSFAECIELAANHDGDSDSTASMAGQLYGARYGIGCLPADAVERIDVIEALIRIFEEWEGTVGVQRISACGDSWRRKRTCGNAYHRS